VLIILIYRPNRKVRAGRGFRAGTFATRPFL
jgi:ribosomal protein L13E